LRGPPKIRFTQRLLDTPKTLFLFQFQHSKTHISQRLIWSIDIKEALVITDNDVLQLNRHAWYSCDVSITGITEPFLWDHQAEFSSLQQDI